MAVNFDEALAIKRKQMRETLSKETGWERIIRMYSLNEYGWMSPELQYILKNGSTATLAAGFVGSVIYMNRAKDNYFRRNVASTFESQHLARRHLTDAMTLSALRGGLKYALQYGSFSTFYLLGTMTAANYNNRVTVWEHIASGAVVGGIFRLNYGMKGVLAASGVGGFLGLCAGMALVTSMWLTGTTLEDLRYWQHENYFAKIAKKKND